MTTMTDQRPLTAAELELLPTGPRQGPPAINPAARTEAPVGAGATMPREGPAGKRLKEYDFRHPEKFARDQLRTLQGIHEQLLRLLNSSLAGYLRTPVQVTLDALEQSSYQEFIAQSREGDLLYVVTADPLPAPLLLEVSSDLVFASIDRLLGGVGKRLERLREPTEMERALFQENWLSPALQSLAEAWRSIVTITPSIRAMETNASFIQIALPTDVVVTVRMSAAIGDVTGGVRLCYPYATLEPVVPQLDTQRLIGAGASRGRPDDTESVRRELNAVRVPVTVQLGSAEVTVEELLELQRGDVIRLGTLVEQEVDVLINGRLKYRARPGLKRHRLAARITAVVDSDAGSEFGESRPV
jgi:flagellar motor switch protein FliM